MSFFTFILPKNPRIQEIKRERLRTRQKLQAWLPNDVRQPGLWTARPLDLPVDFIALPREIARLCIRAVIVGKGCLQMIVFFI